MFAGFPVRHGMPSTRKCKSSLGKSAVMPSGNSIISIPRTPFTFVTWPSRLRCTLEILLSGSVWNKSSVYISFCLFAHILVQASIHPSFSMSILLSRFSSVYPSIYLPPSKPCPCLSSSPNCRSIPATPLRHHLHPPRQRPLRCRK